MINIVIFCVIVILYFGFEQHRDRQAYMAILLYGVYILIYEFVPPFPSVTSSHIGKLYGLVPMLSVGAILFPHFNTKSPEVVTRCIGWLGLLSVFVILAMFKILIW
ncbi:MULTISPECIES: hypothetical protein [Shewanella]|uniref:Uncharacterized protein n=2 Tax=Shewanella putrefaciens TaxID=24 RepID=E6XLT8_SHEP2|nr:MULTISPECIES: hypothetical protein [Shewanella]CAD6367299.1 hypothetical protein SHEWT2_02602 [Shewanella hafniensis]MCT8943303.1 hypothetical protein [Shewanella putrefaciens]MDR6963819.1 hypothetical protein [Shewanella putrefaciens]QSE50212.1 hypothetical protein JW975_04145 [Shewanella putrefaciens]QYX73622.1 hypothetical protein K3G22_04135 [Shewanella putrefaciens]